MYILNFWVNNQNIKSKKLYFSTKTYRLRYTFILLFNFFIYIETNKKKPLSDEIHPVLGELLLLFYCLVPLVFFYIYWTVFTGSLFLRSTLELKVQFQSHHKYYSRVIIATTNWEINQSSKKVVFTITDTIILNIHLGL